MVAMDFKLVLIYQPSRYQNEKQSEYKEYGDRRKKVLRRDKCYAGKDR